MDYQQLRTFADSWGLLSMALFMIGVVAWTFRPSARRAQEDARMIPLRDDVSADLQGDLRDDEAVK